MPSLPPLLPELAAEIQPDRMPESFPRPIRVSLNFGTDHTGESAYYAYLVYPDSEPDETFTWDTLEPVFDWIHRKIWEAGGEQYYPYIYARRESELP